MNEDVLQRAVASYLDVLQEYKKDFIWFHVPNGMRSSVIQGKKMKASGMKAGVPDITIIRSKGRSLFIELKVEGRNLSEKQKAFHDELNRLEIPVYTVKANNGGEAVAMISEILEAEGMK